MAVSAAHDDLAQERRAAHRMGMAGVVVASFALVIGFGALAFGRWLLASACLVVVIVGVIVAGIADDTLRRLPR